MASLAAPAGLSASPDITPLSRVVGQPLAPPSPPAPAVTDQATGPQAALIQSEAQPTGLARVAQGVGNAVKADAQDIGNFGADPWGFVGAAGYSALNSTLLGIPDMIVKAVSSPAYADLKKLQAKHPGATAIGDIGSMFIPGLGALGLAGKALKGAAIGADALRMGKTASRINELLRVAEGGEGIGKIAQGAAGGLVQSIPRAITSGITTGDLGSSAAQVAGGAILGGAGGAILGKTAANAPMMTNELAESADKALVNGALGINSTKAFRKMLGTQATPEQIEAAYQKSADWIRSVAKDNDGYMAIKPVLKDMVSGTGKTWDAFAAKFNEAQPKLSDPANLANINSSPAVQELTSVFGNDGQTALNKMIMQVDQSANFASKRALLDAYSNAGFRSDDPMKQYLGQAAKELKGQIDDIAVKLTPDADLPGMKQAYAAMLPIKKMLQADAFKGENIFKEGSQTAARLAAQSLKEKGPGALATGLINPAFGAAQLAGDVVNRAIPAVGNKIGSMIGDKLGPALRSPGVQALAQKLGDNATAIAGAGGKIGAGAAQTARDIQTGTPKDEELATPEEVSVAAQVPGGAEKVSAEGVAPPGAASAAKQAVNEQYLGVINNRLQGQYQ